MTGHPDEFTPALQRWWWRLRGGAERERMAACGARLGELMDSLERSGHLNTVTGRRPRVVIRLVRELTEIKQELLR